MRKYLGTFIACFLALIAVSLSVNSALGESNNQIVRISKIKIKGADHVSIKGNKRKDRDRIPIN